MQRLLFALGGMVLVASTWSCQSAAPSGGNGPNVPDIPDGPAVTGILVTTPPGAVNEIFDLYTADGSRRISLAHDLNVVLEVDPGTYLLTQYFNENFVYARDVVVAAGQVTTIEMGAVVVDTTADSDGAIYDIYDATGELLLSRPNDSDVIIPVPPATYTLKEYFADFVYASGVAVAAGEIVTVQMGAIRYDGEEPTYDIYDETGTIVLVRPASQGENRPVPPGTYVLKDYFAELVLAEDVVVTTGQTTVVP